MELPWPLPAGWICFSPLIRSTDFAARRNIYPEAALIF